MKACGGDARLSPASISFKPSVRGWTSFVKGIQLTQKWPDSGVRKYGMQAIHVWHCVAQKSCNIPSLMTLSAAMHGCQVYLSAVLLVLS